MRSESLKHDVAWTLARNILDIFAPLLREDEQHDAFVEVYLHTKTWLETYETRADRMFLMMHPGKN